VLVVDTCVLVDIAEEDPTFGRASAQCLAEKLSEALAISPVSYVELAPLFDGSTRLLEEFLAGTGVQTEIFNEADRAVAFAAWARHISRKRSGESARRPVADVLIGATATRCGGIITRNGKDFRTLYPELRIVEP
jgi:predicted nucleic acid-binding protein